MAKYSLYDAWLNLKLTLVLSTTQALPSPTQNHVTNQTKVKKIHIYLAVLTAIDL